MDTTVPHVNKWFDVTSAYDIGGIFIGLGLVVCLLFLVYYTHRFKKANKRLKPDMYQEIRWWLRTCRSAWTAMIGWGIIKIIILLMDIFV